jgi:hypothetical protein
MLILNTWNKNLTSKVLLWIRVHIGSGFNDFVDPDWSNMLVPDPYWIKLAKNSTLKAPALLILRCIQFFLGMVKIKRWILNKFITEACCTVHYICLFLFLKISTKLKQVLNLEMLDYRNAGKNVSPASLVLPLVRRGSPASAFRHWPQSGTASHGLFR